MPSFKDRTNDRYGRLVVKKHVGKDKRNKHLWLCLCDCGKYKTVVADNLCSGKSNSCGCLKTEATKPRHWVLGKDREKAILRIQHSHLRRRHIRKKCGGVCIEFEDFRVLSFSECKYCGLPYSREIQDRINESPKKRRLSDTVLKINGIDRVDSSIGYTKENSVACCKRCNTAKHVMSERDFYEWIKKVYEYNFK